MYRAVRFLRLAVCAAALGPAQVSSQPKPLEVVPPGPTCDQQIAQKLAVPGVNLTAAATYPLSREAVPSLGFATTDMSAAIDPLMVNFMNQYGLPGGVLAMTYNNQLIFAKSYGYADVGAGAYAQPDSRFRVASASKAITAMAILKLIRDGRMALTDTPFGKSGLPGVGSTVGGPYNKNLEQVTVDDLLHHAGGWETDYEAVGRWTCAPTPPFEFNPPCTYQWTKMTLPAVETLLKTSSPPDCTTLLRYVETVMLDFTPGKQGHYSNVGFCALSEIVREKGGTGSYFDYVRSNVLNPLGMNDTTLGSTQRSRQQDREAVYYVCGYDPASGPFPATYKVTCGYSPTNTVTWANAFTLSGPSAFVADGSVSQAYGSSFSLEASEGAGGMVTTAVDLSRFVGSIASGKLPNFSLPLGLFCIGPYPSPLCAWPQAYYSISSATPSFAVPGAGWDSGQYPFGAGWDTVTLNAVPPMQQFLPYDDFNLVKGGGFPGTTSEVATTADGYGVAMIFNGDIGDSIDPLGGVFWPGPCPGNPSQTCGALQAAYNHQAAQKWTLDFSPEYSQTYTGWMDESAFATYLAAQKSVGVYPSRVEGRLGTVTLPRVGEIQAPQYRARFSGQSSTAQPNVLYGQSCSTVLSAIEAEPATMPLVSLQKFDSGGGTFLYQAVWSTPIPQLPF
jgi:N-acyl-D-amino-acid deacylase